MDGYIPIREISYQFETLRIFGISIFPVGALYLFDVKDLAILFSSISITTVYHLKNTLAQSSMSGKNSSSVTCVLLPGILLYWIAIGKSQWKPMQRSTTSQAFTRTRLLQLWTTDEMLIRFTLVATAEWLPLVLQELTLRSSSLKKIYYPKSTRWEK